MYLWANKAQFVEVSLRHIDEDSVFDVAMPSAHGVDDDAGESRMPHGWFRELTCCAAGLVGITPVGQAEHADIYTTPEQLTEGLLTLSLVPRSRWQTLLNLDTIKVRRAGPRLSAPWLTFAPLSNGTSRKRPRRRRCRRRSSSPKSGVSRLVSISVAWKLRRRMPRTRGISSLLRVTLLGGCPDRRRAETVSTFVNRTKLPLMQNFRRPKLLRVRQIPQSGRHRP